MKLFRSLVMAAAAISSFQSFAGVISFNWDPAKHESSFERSYSDQSIFDLRTIVNADMQPVNIKLNTDAKLGSVAFDSGILSFNPTTLRTIGFESSHSFANPLLNQQNLCSYTHFDTSDCDITGAQAFESVFSITMYKHAPNQFGLSVNHSTSFRLKHTEKDIDDSYSTLIREYVSTLSQVHYFDANAPIWLKNLQAPSIDELQNLSASSLIYSQLLESFQLSTMSCDVSGITCPTHSSNIYFRNLVGTTDWQTETVPLPTTASFLLLGVAGLALRRRLAA